MPVRSARQERICAELTALNPLLSSLYEFAVDIINDSAPARSDFVMLGHACRELIGNLPSELDIADLPQERSNVDAATARLDDAWAKHSGALGDPNQPIAATAPGTSESVTLVPTELFNATATLVMGSRQITANMRAKLSALVLGHGEGRDHPTVVQLHTAYNFMAGLSHISNIGKSREMPDRDLVTQNFAIIEDTLEARVGSFFEVVDTLRDILAKANAKECPELKDGGS